MGLFDRNAGRPVFLNEGTSLEEQLRELESFRDLVPASLRSQLDSDIRCVRSGISGESDVEHELRNSHMDMYVLKDLHLELDGTSAQIDFLVLTRQRYFVIECKNLYGNIRVDEHGDFIRQKSGGRTEGMYSPTSQNRKHLDLIRDLRKERRGALYSLLIRDKDFYDQYRSLVVFSNKRTILDDRNAPKNVRSQIVRADRLVETILAINNERGIGRDKVPMAIVEKNARWFLEQDTGSSGASLAAKYSIAIAEWETEGTPYADSAPTAGSSSLDAVPACPNCGAPMVLRRATRGDRKGKQFWGCSTYPRCRGIINID